MFENCFIKKCCIRIGSTLDAYTLNTFRRWRSWNRKMEIMRRGHNENECSTSETSTTMTLECTHHTYSIHPQQRRAASAMRQRPCGNLCDINITPMRAPTSRMAVSCFSKNYNVCNKGKRHRFQSTQSSKEFRWEVHCLHSLAAKRNTDDGKSYCGSSCGWHFIYNYCWRASFEIY